MPTPAIMATVARNLGLVAAEGLAHLGLTSLVERLSAALDLAPERALAAVTALELEVHAAVQALGRAPRWCGVCAAVAGYRVALANLARVVAESGDFDDGYLSPSDYARSPDGRLGEEWDS